MSAERCVIEVVGRGKLRCYRLCRMMGVFAVPVERKAYRSEAEARERAQRLGLAVGMVGDLFELQRKSGRAR